MLCGHLGPSHFTYSGSYQWDAASHRSDGKFLLTNTFAFALHSTFTDLFCAKLKRFLRGLVVALPVCILGGLGAAGSYPGTFFLRVTQTLTH